ncbi:HlyD family efflux transporter periplasmic adaptor subunit [Gloeocapsa sp. PCC 73106]|uniref:HlyD family efflux transporter periplasmic adaptor subunit n=1 Tax=Gloeocapsa sp. PCC 73106 TaxID=102232 RepID=UPI0002ABE4DB|nr:HlyD family efflux transporter periplasmic adaptor subunit [Gloeocapsa sp. PCC 73106]ELR98423.1 ABC exporter membrane fusion protein, DevB family [Gloeocapsa sp. PCC 73106]
MLRDEVEIFWRAYDPNKQDNWVKSHKKELLIASIIFGLLGSSLMLSNLPKLIAENSSESSANEEVIPEIKAVTALGRIEPKGEVAKIAATPNLGGSKIMTLLVQEGDQVEQNQVVALLDNHLLQKAALEVSIKEVELQKSQLAIVQAGAKEGEVKAQEALIGRLKAELNAEKSRNQAEIARWQAELAGEKQGLSANIQRLKAEYNNANLEFGRYQVLAESGAISTSELDQRRLTLETSQELVQEAEANLSKTIATLEQAIKEAQAAEQKQIESLTLQIKEAEATLAKISEVREVEINEAKAKLDKAIAQSKHAQQELALSEVRAPFTGRVLKIHSYPGENISNTDGVMELGQTNQMMIIAEVHESDISQVKIGQEVLVTSESGAFSSQLKGTVAEMGWQIGQNDVLGNDPAADVDKRVVEVKILLEPEASAQVEHLTYSQVLVKILL